MHGEVPADAIVSGYEYARGQTVVVDPAALDALRPQSDPALAIDAFVRPEAIDPLYHTGQTYYLLPDGPAGAKPYALLYGAMLEHDRHAVVQGAFGGREQLGLVRPLAEGGLLVLSVLAYAHQRKPPEVFLREIPAIQCSGQERKLAALLLEAATAEPFQLDRYPDRYTERLRSWIEAQIEGRQVAAAPPQQSQPEVGDLLEALHRSVEGIGRTNGAAPRRSPVRRPLVRGRRAKPRAPRRKRA